MRYAHLIASVAGECWAMDRAKIDVMVQFLAVQAAGGKFSEDEIAARIGASEEQATARSEGAVAVIGLHGVVANRMGLMTEISGGASCERLGAQLRAAIADDGIKAIVLDVNSPGGAVTGVDELSQAIFEARGVKPIVAQVDSHAASAAYWIASAADEVVVTPSGGVGAIGVYTVHRDISKALAEAGVEMTLIGEPEAKGEGEPFMPMTDDLRAHLEAMVGTYSDMFVERVAQNRGVEASRVRSEFGRGRLVLAHAAVAAGMADGIATMRETLARFGAEAAPAAKPRGVFAREREKRALNI